MKEGSSIMIEKPFSCDIDGCLMKFTNEDHLMVHKKRHDMVLNLGLASKGNTFSDQTPTPTRFIRNCEEVGLFQDLQNVNPFEETFRKAAEAVKTGQAPNLDKTFQSNAPDDTLHTPNIFPHIVDLQCVTQSGSLVNHESKQSQEDVPKKDEDLRSDEKELPAKPDLEVRKLILGSVNHKKRKIENCDKPLIIEVQNNIFNQLTTSENEKPCQQDEFTEIIGEINPIQLALKEKIKNNLQNKQPTIIQLKVPIPKSNSSIRCQKSQKDKFSTFSKNSLKYESKLEKPQSGIFDLSKKRRTKKSYSGLPKERIEILERNRAAATRCREKKKSYISYLEKLSRELTETNKKLQLQNNHYRKQISVLQTELLKHQNCNVTASKRDVILTTAANVEISKNSEVTQETGQIKNEIVKNTETVAVNNKDEDGSFKCTDNFDLVTTVFDPVEAPASENVTDNENRKSVCFGSHDVSNNDVFSSRIFCEEDKLRKVYSDHSYSTFTNTIESAKKNFTSSVCKSKLNSNVLCKDFKSQKAIQKNDKELFNTALTQVINPDFGSLDSSEPMISVSQPAFVLKAPASRKSKVP